MPSFVLYAENAFDSASPGAAAPTAGQIEAALRNIPIVGAQAARAAAGDLDYGNWVGTPRVTRLTTLTLTPFSPNRFTRVAWLYSYPTPPGRTAAQLAQTDASLRDYIRAQGAAQLRAIPGQQDRWGSVPGQSDSLPGTVEILSYDPTVNGSVAWWTCANGTTPTACAASTRTRDTFDLNQQLGGSSTVESPSGPQLTLPPLDVDPLTPFGGSQNLNGLLTTLGWLVAGGTALYFLWPVLEGGRDAAVGARRLSAVTGAAGSAAPSARTSRTRRRAR